MKFMYMHEYVDADLGDVHEVCRVDFSNPDLQEVLRNLKKNCDKEVLRAVRLVGNSKITNVNIKRLEYTVEDRVLSLAKLSSAEFCFMLAEISKQTGVKFVMIDCVRIMSNRTLKLFYERYKECEVYLVMIDGELESYYRMRELEGR